MICQLSRVAEDLSKIVHFNADAIEVNPDMVHPKVDICFIDGEHTNQKVISDFNFCADVLNAGGIVVFHDTSVIFKGLTDIIASLKRSKQKFDAYFCPGDIFVISFPGVYLERDAEIADLRKHLRLRDRIRKLVYELVPDFKTRARAKVFLRTILMRGNKVKKNT